MGSVRRYLLANQAEEYQNGVGVHPLSGVHSKV